MKKNENNLDKRYEILKLKLDYHKTMLTIFMALIITSAIGYWTLDNMLGKNVCGIVALISAVAGFVSLYYYNERHKQTIDSLR
jgi:hypothetical protein